MGKFKKGSKFRHLSSDVEIIERYDNLLLAKITPDLSAGYYDISNVQLDNYGEEQFYPSPNGNGLKSDTIPGEQRQPKSLDEMQQAFDNLVTAAKKKAIAAAEARERAEAREQELVDKKRKGQEAKDHRKALNDQLKALVATSSDLKDFTTNKTVKKIAEEIYITELFISNI